MPRTGGVYSPPAGTKGVSNTTIQSVPYNSFVDDLTADANAARPITAGGTGATTASGARTALGVEIGTNVQAYDAGLQSIAGLTTSADKMIYTTGSDAYATTALTPFGRSILDDADAATVRGTLGLVIGTNVQAQDAELQAIAGLVSAADRLPYFTGSGTASLATFTGAARNLLDDPDAATMRATIGANDASNLTTGTVSDARLPTTQAGKTFTGTSTFGAVTVNSGFLDVFLGSGNPPRITLWQDANNAFRIISGPTNFIVQHTSNAWAGIDAEVLNVAVGQKVWTDALATGAASSGWVKLPNNLILQSGSSVATTNASSDGSIPYPSTFPTACLSAVACCGDANSPVTELEVIAGLGTTGFNFRANGAPSQGIRVNWIAWGY